MVEEREDLNRRKGETRESDLILHRAKIEPTKASDAYISASRWSAGSFFGAGCSRNIHQIFITVPSHAPPR
jgi:hypothetical protein